MDNREQKQALRKWIREKQKSLTADYCKAADQAICRRILNLPAYRAAKTMFCFVGTSEEIDTKALLERAWQDGKCVLVPRCAEKGRMDAYEISSMEDLEKGQYGILEPKKQCRQALPNEIDFAVIPCMSCDLHGHRLGHGGGYYDRYLEHTAFETAVVCRAELMQEQVPVDCYDKKMDWVISERESHQV